MEYHIKASSQSNQDAVIHIKASIIAFGTTPNSAESLPNPAELFLGSFASCALKNVERFSGILKFDYTNATIEVHATRLENPPRMDNINYHLTVHSSDENLNPDLLKKNIEKFGTIYNTVKMVCSISGTVSKV